MIQVMSRGNSIIAGVVLIGILGTLSIALQATAPSKHIVSVSSESLRATAHTAVPSKKTEPQAIGCFEGVEYKIRKNKVSCKPKGSCVLPEDFPGYTDLIWKKESYSKAGADECYATLITQYQKDTSEKKNKDPDKWCEPASAETCDLQQCYTKKDGKEYCVKVKGTFKYDQGFAPANNESFAMRELVRKASGGDTDAVDLLKSLKAEGGTINGIDQAFKDVIDDGTKAIQDATGALAYCKSMPTACSDPKSSEEALEQAKAKLQKTLALNDQLKKEIGSVKDPKDPPNPGDPGNQTPGPGQKGPGTTPEAGPGNKQPATGFGNPLGQSGQSPTGQGATNAVNQCSPRYHCTNGTLYWGTPQQQTSSWYSNLFGSNTNSAQSCPNQVVQTCQYGCAQTGSESTQCASNPQATAVPTATLSCGSGVADVGSQVPITYTCTNSVSSTGVGFSAIGVPTGTVPVTIQKPPAGTDIVRYGITCVSSSNQTASRSCDILINTPSIVMVANPKSIAENASTTLGWITRGMKECVVQALDAPERPELEQFNSENARNTAVSGVAVTPALTSDTTFSLSCKTKSDQTKSASVIVKVE